MTSFGTCGDSTGSAHRDTLLFKGNNDGETDAGATRGTQEAEQGSPGRRLVRSRSVEGGG